MGHPARPLDALMRERRFLIPDIPTEGEVVIAGAEAHHLLHVLRLRPDDEVVLFDGQGKEFEAVLTRCDKTTAAAKLLKPVATRESPLELTVAVAVPKTDSMARIVQKLTELGVHRIVPLLTSRTAVSPRRAAGQSARWRRIAEEACKQSGRGVVPQIEDAVAFEDFIERDDHSCRLLFTVGGPSLRGGPRPSPCLVIIGPEGGWAEEELAAALAKGFEPVGLGPRTLRTETAALAATAILEWLSQR